MYRKPRNLWQISGWDFDDLDITVRQRLCEALYATGRIKQAGESLLDVANTINKDIYMTGPIVTWVSGKLCYRGPVTCIQYLAIEFLRQCLSTPETGVDTTLHSPSPTLLLREWAKSKLTGSSWREALVTALNVVSPLFCASHVSSLMNNPIQYYLCRLWNRHAHNAFRILLEFIEYIFKDTWGEIWSNDSDSDSGCCSRK